MMMSNTFRLHRLAVSTMAVLMFIVVACGNVVASEQKVIRYMTFMPAETEQQIVENFTKSHPDIVVKVEPLGFSDEYFEKILTSVATGSAPEVVAMNYEQFSRFVAAGAFAPLNSLIKSTSFDVDRYFLQVFNLFNFSGNQMAVPATFSNVVMFYNTSLFEEAGLRYPASEWTWDDLVTAGKKLVRDTNRDGVTDVYGYAIQWWPIYLAMNGVTVLNQDNTRTRVDEPAAVEAIQRVIDTWAVHRFAINPTSGISDWDTWKAGYLAMWPTGPWAIGPFLETSFDWDVAHHPGMARKATFLYSNALAIPTGTKNLAEAWELIQYLAGPEGSRIRQGSGYELSPLRDVANLLAQGQRRPKSARVFFEATTYAVSPPTVADWDKIHDMIYNQIDQAYRGQVSPALALKTAAQQVNAFLATKK
jgi:multiple sugar transport system substrate-binding protein